MTQDSLWLGLAVVVSAPLLWRIGRKLLAGNWATDLIAGVSIITGILTGQYIVALIIVVMLVGGGILESYAVRRASSALNALAERVPTLAHRVVNNTQEDVKLDAVQVGDHLLILPHEISPADAVVVRGQGRMDESFLTGEPYDVKKAPGVQVISGAKNGPTLLEVQVLRRPQDSRYAQIMGVMKESELKRPRIRRLADQLGAWYSPAALLIAGLAGWLNHDWQRFLAVVVVATPCPLLIAIPVALIGTISRAARQGIIIRDPSILERISEIKTFIFDKTGTLTRGKAQLVSIIPATGVDPKEALAAIASLERYSKHPLAAPLLAGAEQAGLTMLDCDEVNENAGQGMTARIGPDQFRVIGRKSYQGSDPLPPLPPGSLECILEKNGKLAATFQFFDAPRGDTRLFLQHLGPRHSALRTVLLTGDQAAPAEQLGKQVGIGEVRANQTPEQKLAFLHEANKAGPTLYVGDGINDAPALAAATVGVAFGGGSNVTSEAASAVILEPSLGKIDELLHLGIRLRRIALQSTVGGLSLSVVGMIAAAFGYLPPLYGALFQEAIDVLSVLNALRTSLGTDPPDYDQA